MHIFDAQQGAKLRALVRAATIAITAFWAQLSVEQVAAVQLLLEAVIGVLTFSPLGDAPTEGGE